MIHHDDDLYIHSMMMWSDAANGYEMMTTCCLTHSITLVTPVV